MINVTFEDKPVTLIGSEIKVGESAPNFTVLRNDLSEVTLKDYKGKVKLISVVPSVDTGVCSEQTKRFNDEANAIAHAHVITISMDLPFAQKRWSNTNNVQNLDILSDHRYADFGKQYGVLIQEMRLLTRAIFVVDSNDSVTYVEYVKEVNRHPDYEKALLAAKDTE